MYLAMLDADPAQVIELSKALPGTVGSIALFTFLSVAVWVSARRAEREAYYKAEMMKKIAEASATGSSTSANTQNQTPPALAYLREQERIAAARQLGGIKLGGLVVSGVGLGVIIFLKALLPAQPIYLCGTIILFVGLALLAYAFWFAPGRNA